MEGAELSYIGLASNTDLVNSGSYFTELLVVVFGITSLVGLGGSFLITGFTFCFIETKDWGSLGLGFLITTGGFSTALAATATGFTGAATGLATGLAICFCGTGFAAGFFAGALATGFEGFFAALAGIGFFTIFFGAGFLATAFFGAGLLAFFGAGFFLLAMSYPFFKTITFSKTSLISISIPP
ncbi:MAG TPA: hypothetical protein VF487_13895 [Chitinophagaceae bacterium]